MAANALIAGGSKSPPAIEAPELTSSQFWAEFIRVQFDKLLLVYTMWFCFHIGYHDGIIGAFGALLYALQSNRFKRN